MISKYSITFAIWLQANIYRGMLSWVFSDLSLCLLRFVTIDGWALTRLWFVPVLMYPLLSRGEPNTKRAGSSRPDVVFGLNMARQWHSMLTLTNLTHNSFILYYNTFIRPLHVSSNVVLIIRRSNCINTTSGIVTLCKWPSGAQVACAPDGHLTESDNTRVCINTIWPPDDEHDVAGNI